MIAQPVSFSEATPPLPLEDCSQRWGSPGAVYEGLFVDVYLRQIRCNDTKVLRINPREYALLDNIDRDGYVFVIIRVQFVTPIKVLTLEILIKLRPFTVVSKQLSTLRDKFFCELFSPVIGNLGHHRIVDVANLVTC